MSPFEAYKAYLSIKMHFTTSTYDFFKYDGKVSASQQSFNKRKDKWFFTKLAKLREPHDVVLANVISNPKSWIGKIVDVEGISTYQQWQKKIESLSYFVKLESENLDEDFISNFNIIEDEHPPILKAYLSNKISIETLIILLDISEKLEYIDTKLKDDIVWLDVKNLYSKYKPFLEYDKEKITKVLENSNFFTNFPEKV